MVKKVIGNAEDEESGSLESAWQDIEETENDGPGEREGEETRGNGQKSWRSAGDRMRQGLRLILGTDMSFSAQAVIIPSCRILPA